MEDILLYFILAMEDFEGMTEHCVLDAVADPMQGYT